MAAPPDDPHWHTVSVRVPFASPEHARIALAAIQVDKELQPHAVKRTLLVDDAELVATFSTVTIRLARLALNAFLDNLDLVVRTLSEFADDAAAPAPPPIANAS